MSLATQNSPREIASARRTAMIRGLFGDLIGKLILTPGLTDITANSDGKVFATVTGEGKRLAGRVSPAEAEKLIVAVAKNAGETVGPLRPSLAAEVEVEGFELRFQGFLRPVVRNPAFIIRKPASRVYTLREYLEQGVISGRQLDLLERAVACWKNVLICGGTGTGKAQPLDALVLTPTGFRPMGEIQVGDLVACPDGTTAPVKGVFPQGEKEIYRVTFEDGRTAECCDEHLWKVWAPLSSYVRGSGRNGPRKHRLGWRVVPLRTIRGWFENGRLKSKRAAVPLVAPCVIEMPPADLPVPPYALGALLGDGNLTNSSVGFTTVDDFILHQLLDALPAYEAGSRGKSAIDYRLRMKVRQKPSPLRVALEKLGVWGCGAGQKFVPPCYKTAGVAQRLAVLQGLLDTDGSVDGSGLSASFTSTSERLARDVQELAWSLGAIAKIAGRQTFACMPDGSRRPGSPSWRVSIVHEDIASFFSLPRKVAACRRRSVQHRLRIISIEAVGRKPAQCISVGHPDQLYVTNDFIVTHNTTLMNALLEAVGRLTPNDRVCGVERTRELQCPVEDYEFLRVSDTYSAQVGLQDLLRSFPKRIMVGEVRGAEALEMLMAWNTGHDGGFCTIHSKTSRPSPRAALLRVEQAASLAATTTPLRLQPMIGEVVDLVVCISLTDANPAGRIVSYIGAVNGWNGTDYDIEKDQSA